jgi:sulfide:quinone oxidoreductase
MSATRPKLVVLGGGFAGLRLLFHLYRIAEITLVDPRPTSLAKPMLVEVALAGKPVEHSRFPLAPVVTRHHARFVCDTARWIDPGARTVILAGGETLGYDYLAVATGAVKNYQAIAGLEEHGYSVCDDRHAPALWQALEGFTGGPIVTGAAPSTWGTRITVPSLLAACEGPIGEAAFMAHHDLSRRGLDHSISVFSPGEVFFDDVGDTVRGAIGPLLGKAGVTITTAKTIAEVATDHVSFSDGTEMASVLSIVIPPYVGPAVLRDSGLGDEAGFLAVDQTMAFLDDSRIVGAGDATALSMPKLGHIAIHQADLAAASLRAQITGDGEIPPYRPEVFCIMNRGGAEATLILSDTLYGGVRDIARSGPGAHLLKWSFDAWSFHTRGHLPPAMMQEGLEMLLGA